MTHPVAIITGAGSGIGRAIALQLSGEGYTLTLVGRRAEPLQQTARMLDTESLVARADVSEEAGVDAMIAATIGRFGRIDALISNAGYAPVATIPETTAQIVRECLAINAFGPIYAVARAWPHLVESRGCIVSISTMGTVDPFPVFYAYAAAKASLDVVAKAAAGQGGPHGIRGFTIAPGAVETDMFRANFPKEQVPVDRTLDPSDVARVVVECVLGKRNEDNGRTILLPSP